MKKEILEKELGEFLKAEAKQVPPGLSQKILGEIQQELNPSPLMVFTRLVEVVLIVGLVTLLICPQFGVGFLRHSGLYHVFMSLGPYGCKLACGAFFLGASLLAATLVLRPEELKVLKRRRLLMLSAVSALSLAAFVAGGAEVFVQAFAFWFLGSLAGAWLSMELGLLARRVLLRPRPV